MAGCGSGNGNRKNTRKLSPEQQRLGIFLTLYEAYFNDMCPARKKEQTPIWWRVLKEVPEKKFEALLEVAGVMRGKIKAPGLDIIRRAWLAIKPVKEPREYFLSEQKDLGLLTLQEFFSRNGSPEATALDLRLKRLRESKKEEKTVLCRNSEGSWVSMLDVIGGQNERGKLHNGTVGVCRTLRGDRESQGNGQPAH